MYFEAHYSNCLENYNYQVIDGFIPSLKVKYNT